jgi:hypothetical protein
MNILAHRGLVQGPDRALENRADTVEAALAIGFGLETDIRFWSSQAYISHDRLPESPDPSMSALDHVGLWSGSTAPIALNFKEPGTAELLVDFLERTGTAGRVCVFDMELVEDVPGSTAHRLRELHPGLLLAARASDRQEPLERALALPGEVVWMDEFEGPWIGQKEIEAVHRAGKQAWMVLPDLHGATRERMARRLVSFADWGADTICTDWALDARQILESRR